MLGASWGPKLRAVAVGTGTKCLAGEARSPRGDLLNDSHAEARALSCFWQTAHRCGCWELHLNGMQCPKIAASAWHQLSL